MDNTVLEFIKANKKAVVVVTLALAVLLVFLTEMLPSGTPKETTLSGRTEKEYEEALRENLTRFIESIDGAGEAEVLISFESGYEAVFAEEKSSSSSTVNDLDGVASKQQNEGQSSYSYILVRGSDGSEQPVELKKLSPRIAGIAVSCTGGDSAAVREKLTGALRAALSLPSHKISINKLARRN